MDRLLGPGDHSRVHYCLATSARARLLTDRQDGPFLHPKESPKVNPSRARGKHAPGAGNSVPRDGKLLSRRLPRMFLGDVQDQRPVVAMPQPVFGTPYSEIGRDVVAQECVVNVMPESEVPGVKVCFRWLRPLGVHRVAVVHAAAGSQGRPKEISDTSTAGVEIFCCLPHERQLQGYRGHEGGTGWRDK
jgi:hypothetical protein